MERTAQDILDFWLDEIGPEGWFNGPPELDQAIRDRYLALWETARAGGLDGWQVAPRPCLALLILIDQFPRNMFRNDPRAFATDARALAIAKQGIERRQDAGFDFPARGFFHLPLMHSENIADQERCVRLSVLTGAPASSLHHARAHRYVIRRFGRFPYRNAALGRTSTPEEEAFLEAGGYGFAMAQAAA